MERRIVLIATLLACALALLDGLQAAAGEAGGARHSAEPEEGAGREVGGYYELQGRLSYIEADRFGVIEHLYAWRLPPAARMRAELHAAFEPLLEILDEEGGLVAQGDDEEGAGVAELDVEVGDGGLYYIRVSSASWDEAGEYTLRVWQQGAGDGERPERVAAPVAGVRHRGRLEVGSVYSGSAGFEHPISRHEIAPLEEGAVYDVWLFSDHDFDLYGAVTAHGTVLADGASKEAFGYEHIRLAASEGATAIVIHAALYEPLEEAAPYHLLVKVHAPGPAGAPASEKAAGLAEPGEVGAVERLRSPYGGRLVPGERVAAGIEPALYTTQFWTLVVPPGTRRVEVGIFGADRDLDLSLEPGWVPSPFGMEHGVQSATRRWNDRIALDGGARGVPPGLYTVAVWPSGAAWSPGDGAPLRYAIELRFDEPLPPSGAYAFLAPGEMGSLSGEERARLAAVWIESDFFRGAGALVSPDGMILTSYSAVLDCHPELSAPVGCMGNRSAEARFAGPAAEGFFDGFAELGDFEAPFEEQDVEEYLVWVVDRATGEAVQRFVAEVVAAEPRYDLALLKIVGDVDGAPWPPGEAAGVFPYLDVDTGVAHGGGRPESGWRSEGPPRLAAVGFPDPDRVGAPSFRPIEPQDVMVRERPFALYEIRMPERLWHSGALFAAPSHGLVLGLFTERSRLPARDEEVWVAVPTTLVPTGWLTAAAAGQ